MKGGREARLTDRGDWGIWGFGICQLRMVEYRGRRQGEGVWFYWCEVSIGVGFVG
jgi:hypothetical protein